ncbi:MAG: DNA repair protein RecO [Granulosicoccus sp.]
MNRPVIALQPGYILHHSEFRESSLIIDAFILNHGCVSMVARGARKSRPSIRELYQPFRPLLLSWVGDEGLRTLTGIEESGPALPLVAAELACAYYLNELLLRLLPKDQSYEHVFAHYALALSELVDSPLSYEVVLRSFEVQLLNALGVMPDLSHATVDGTKVRADRDYLYHAANATAVSEEPIEAMHLLKDKDNPAARNSLAIHPDGVTEDPGIPVSGNTLIALSELNFDNPATLTEARALMRRIIQLQLGDKPLKSRELFTTLTTLQGLSESNLDK